MYHPRKPDPQLRHGSTESHVETLRREVGEHLPAFSETRHQRLMAAIRAEPRTEAVVPPRRLVDSWSTWAWASALSVVLFVTASLVLRDREPADSITTRVPRSTGGLLMVADDSAAGDSTDAQLSRSLDSAQHGRGSHQVVSAGMYLLLNKPAKWSSQFAQLADDRSSDQHATIVAETTGTDKANERAIVMSFNRVEIDLGDHTVGKLAGSFLGR